MGLHAIAAVLALASPIVGHQVPTDGTADRPVTLLDPVTLEPVPGAPQMPPDTYYAEASPDGSQIAARTEDSVDFYSLRTGVALGTVSDTTFATPSWMTNRRMLLVSSGFGQPQQVSVVNPQTRRVLSTRRLPFGGPVVDTARVKGLQLVLGRSGKLVVLGPNGKTARTLHVTAGLSSAMDHGLVIGLTDENDPAARTVVSAVNPASGRVRRQTMRRLTGTFSFTPGMGTVALAQAGGGYLGFRRTDGRLVRARFRPADGYLVGNGDGYLVAGENTLRAETLSGNPQWNRPLQPYYGSPTTPIGDYIYSQEIADGHYQVRIRSRGTGADVATVPGVFAFQPLAVGQDVNQLVRFDGGQALDTGD